MIWGVLFFVLKSGFFARGSARGQPPASRGIECPAFCGERSEDFRVVIRHESNGIFGVLFFYSNSRGFSTSPAVRAKSRAAARASCKVLPWEPTSTSREPVVSC